MLNPDQIKEQARLEEIKNLCNYYNTALLLGNISKTEYEEEMSIFMEEIEKLEDKYQVSEERIAFDELLGNPLRNLDKLGSCIATK